MQAVVVDRRLTERTGRAELALIGAQQERDTTKGRVSEATNPDSAEKKEGEKRTLVTNVLQAQHLSNFILLFSSSSSASSASSSSSSSATANSLSR